MYETVCGVGCCSVFLKKKAWIVLCFYKVLSDVLHVCVNLVSRKQKIGPISLAALIAHHTPTLTSSNVHNYCSNKMH
jgi:hypothetical protein